VEKDVSSQEEGQGFEYHNYDDEGDVSEDDRRHDDGRGEQADEMNDYPQAVNGDGSPNGHDRMYQGEEMEEEHKQRDEQQLPLQLPGRQEWQPNIVAKNGEFSYCKFMKGLMNNIYSPNVLNVRTVEEFVQFCIENKTISPMDESMGVLSQFDSMVGQVSNKIFNDLVLLARSLL
jgi:hypothetical protein